MSESETARPARTLRQLAGIPVTQLRSLGARKAEALAELGIESVFDLLTTYPYRYIDRSRRVDLAQLASGEQAVVLATVQRVHARRTRQGRSLVEVLVHDGTGAMTTSFFNQPWRAHQLTAGTEALFFGTLGTFKGARRMVNPVVDVVVGGADEAGGAEVARRRTMRIVPVYPASAKARLSSWEIGGWVEEAVRRAGRLADPLPERWRQELGLVDRTRAVHDIHLPRRMALTAPARRRLAFDELFRLQLALSLRRRALEEDARAIRHAVSARDALPVASGPSRAPAETLVQRFLGGLPFQLTGAQRRAMASVFAEMAGPLPMHRLLQGDVGSGKTVVAVAALLAAVQGGHQGALMVPTEVLAEQHSFAVRGLLAGLAVPDPARLGGERPVEVALLTNRTPAAERRRTRSGLESGAIDIVVGTHALLTDDVQFRSLGLAVVDEQHRFGVEQRAQLRAKGRTSVVARAPGASGDAAGTDPDLLVMTATPIPRTAAMVLFGDLDMVVLDEMPPGRVPVETVWLRSAREEATAWARVREEARAGRCAFVVCPLVEGSERVQARSATEEHARLGAGPLGGLRLGLLHGQMPAAEKEATMEALRAGAIDVLVATTVVEVGVDVPRATVMVIEDAARFGIAQLHQLRGRVGRGDLPSWCYLLGAADAGEAESRLSALVRTTDGFELAETDLELRGEGTILGARQKGRSDLVLASVRKDADLLDAAHQVAEDLTGGDPHLGAHADLADEMRLFLDPEEEAFLFKS